MPFVKICGMTNLEDASLACDFGADAVGFILYPKSPRYIEPAAAAVIARDLPKDVLKVVVGVDLAEEDVQNIESVWAPDLWQLHGSETPERVREFKPRRVWKALGLPLSGKTDPAEYQDQVEAFLLDKASASHGGTGQTFDWNLAFDLKNYLKQRIVLSGGLNPNNVVEALGKVQPWGVDVCSGVEASPGRKDPVKLKEFIRLCQIQ
jgi:phosphoribosylanthranilate isomerase